MNASPLGPPPVDNLSDLAWARVERGVLARLDGNGTVTHASGARELHRAERRPWLWLAVPAAAAAACATMFFALHGTSSEAPAKQPDEEPSRVVTGAAPSTVAFGDAHVTLEANSSIVMDPRAGKPSTLLEDGAATFAVAPRGDRPPFVVLAGDATIRVIGTKFRVARHGEHAEVAVERGEVGIRFRGSEVTLHADERWSSDQPTHVIHSSSVGTPASDAHPAR